MAVLDKEILKDFVVESKGLIAQMNSILEECEGDLSQAKSLEQFGLYVDRIMGAAKSIALTVDSSHMIHKVGDYAAICKAVGYKTSQLHDNQQFYDICVALLMDGIEVLDAMISGLNTGQSGIKELFSQTFLERLRWVSSVFSSDIRSSVDVGSEKGKQKLTQSDIDDLLKKLGLD